MNINRFPHKFQLIVAEWKSVLNSKPGLYLARWERMQHSLSDLCIKCRVRVYHVLVISYRVIFFLRLFLSDKPPSSLKQKHTHTHAHTHNLPPPERKPSNKKWLAFRQHTFVVHLISGIILTNA